MGNTIYTDRFEEFFEDHVLRKGLALYQKKKVVESATAINGNYYFVIKAKKNADLSFKKNDRIISGFRCSCKGKKPCEHLCAAIFYLQPALAEKIFDNSLNRKTPENPLKKLYQKYSAVIKELESKSDKTKITEWILSIKKGSKKNDTDLYYLVLTAIDNITEWLLSSEQKALMLKELSSCLYQFDLKQLGNEQKKYLVFITHNSLASAKKFNIRAFTQLIPYAVSVAILSDIQGYKQQLVKRKLKYFYPSNLDEKLIAYLQILRAEEKLTGRKTLTDYNQTAEFFVAKSELDFVFKRINTGFNTLDKGYLVLNKIKPATYISYMEHCVAKAKQYAKKKVELFYIKQILIEDFLVSPYLLLRIKELIDGAVRETYVNDILKELRNSPKNNIDKINTLLQSEERWDELIHEISKQKNKFHLINAVAFKKLPFADNTLLNIYTKQFQAAINEAAETHYQKYLFDEARKYIDHLPGIEKQKLIKLLLDVVGKHSYIRTYILKCYPFNA